MAAWAEFAVEEPELAAFGRERLDRRICFQATLRADGSPRLDPVEPWIDATRLVALPFVRDASYPLVSYAVSVQEAVATTYEGIDRAPVYQRWPGR